MCTVVFCKFEVEKGAYKCFLSLALSGSAVWYLVKGRKMHALDISNACYPMPMASNRTHVSKEHTPGNILRFLMRVVLSDSAMVPSGLPASTVRARR